jgi:membrane protein DedA with SNARE-associated domain
MNTHPIRKFIQMIVGSDLILPAFLLVAYAVFLFIIRGILPTSEELLTLFSKYYATYGYEILFVAALLESLVLINLFAPGQVALALGIVFSRTGETQLPLVILAVSCGVIVGFIIDYLVGYYGFGDVLKHFGQGSVFDKAKKELKKNGGRSIFISFINPNLGAYMSLAAGASKLEITMFGLIALFSILFWVIAWSLLIYSLGDVVLVIIKKYTLLLSAIFIGILIISFGIKRPAK